MRVTHTFCFALLGVAACAKPETPDQATARMAAEAAAARTAIDAANANWPRLTSTGHSDSIADFYTADAVMMPPNMPMVHGRDSIRAFFTVMNSMKGITLALKAVSVWGSGDAATEMGRWTWTWAADAKRPPGVPPVDSGKYLVRWVQQNGKWLMAQDIWNSDLPTPMAQAAPAKKTR